jgi:hypothetical protein
MDVPNSAGRAEISRRFTTMEGWREVAGSLYYAAGHGLINISINPDIDQNRYEDGEEIITRQASHTSQTSSVRADKYRSFGVTYPKALGAEKFFPDAETRGGNVEDDSPFSDSHAIKDGDVPDTVDEPPQPAAAEAPYHVFTPRQRWQVVAMISAAGLFSGLSSNIYFPALDAIAQVCNDAIYALCLRANDAMQDLNVSLQLVSLTITSYLIIQGISPVIWGSFADALGRRPIYIASFLVYISANVALSFSPNFIVLILFRGLQAAGSASTVSIGMYRCMS